MALLYCKLWQYVVCLALHLYRGVNIKQRAPLNGLLKILSLYNTNIHILHAVLPHFVFNY